MPRDAGEAARQLQDAFEAFNQIGSQLSRSYRALQEKVARLTEELAQARDEKLQQLKEKERLAARLHDLIEALPGGVLVLDREGVVREVNQGAEGLLGKGLEGRAWEEVAAGSFVPGSEVLRLHDGRCLSLSSSALGKAGERVILLSDITETRRLQELLTQRERLAALGEMSARLAHQIRTPLASLLLYLSQLDSPSLEQERRRQFVARARERLRHLEQTVNNMLAYARGSCARREPVSLRWLVEQFVQIMEPELVARGGSLSVEGADGDPGLAGDGDALLGALVNLGTNALEACEQPPRLKLEIRVLEESLLLSLEDNGTGIPEAMRSRVFEPFFTTRANGTGLGLSVVRAVVEGHGGTLRIGDASLGGARITLGLPRSAAEMLPSGTRVSGEIAEVRGEVRIACHETAGGIG
ncbi:MAG TPA: PAS domain-containing protein [Thiolapillus brandeum]|uniref:histidine kinase n=1 Tax=Thiolapillus brandeum TaxID=1076588 RepID=A0A7C5IZM8_9GAMM|nr:PAS domain-containing protein [Thiolapillus brandeum]